MSFISLPRPLTVALLPADVRSATSWLDSAGQQPASDQITAIVIDTLRFTTTACRALQMGSRSIQVASSVARARELARQHQPPALLCGERHCHLIEGFDLGNSPFEYNSENVSGRDLVFTTTNGTLAIEAVRHVPRVLLAALVNRQAVCRHLRAKTIGAAVIVCAGTDGQLTWEDVLTAGGLIDALLATGDFAIAHDTAWLALAAWQNCMGQTHDPHTQSALLLHELSRALGGRNLIAAGYERDLEFAAQLDAIDVIPENCVQRPDTFTLRRA